MFSVKCWMTKLTLLLLVLSACDKIPVDEDHVIQGDEFDIKGKVVNGSGAPIRGVTARLLNTAVSTVTDDNGEYHLKGTVRRSLAKTKSSGSDAADTLLIITASPDGEGDSSEIEKQVVQSGISIEIPEISVVQREIRAPLKFDKRIKTVEAVVYDDSFPEITKTIDLWYDTINEVINSFAYFISSTGKQYSLFICVYDTIGQLYLKSPVFSFPNNAGNIIFSTAMKFERMYTASEGGDLTKFMMDESNLPEYVKTDNNIYGSDKLYSAINGEAELYVKRGLKNVLIQNFELKTDEGNNKNIQIFIADFESNDTSASMFEYNRERKSGSCMKFAEYDESVILRYNFTSGILVFGHYDRYYFEVEISDSMVLSVAEQTLVEIIDFIQQMSLTE